jgi:hypothetical protein
MLNSIGYAAAVHKLIAGGSVMTADKDIKADELPDLLIKCPNLAVLAELRTVLRTQQLQYPLMPLLRAPHKVALQKQKLLHATAALLAVRLLRTILNHGSHLQHYVLKRMYPVLVQNGVCGSHLAIGSVIAGLLFRKSKSVGGVVLAQDLVPFPLATVL